MHISTVIPFKLNLRIPSWGFFVLFVAISISGIPQKKINKQWEAEGIEKIEFSSDQVYLIEIHAVKTSSLKLEVHIEGEHSENVMVSSSITNKTLSLSTQYRPFFQIPNDKLAAHKALSVEVKLIVPEGMEVKISSPLAGLIVRGTYKRLDVTLDQGYCEVKNFLGEALLYTKGGAIIVWAKEGVAGSATSQHGTILNELQKEGNYYIRAESVNGNISLLQTRD